MTITSFWFLVFITVGMMLYYILPKSWQWVELLIMSLVFYCLAATPYTIIYLVISTLVAYLSTNAMTWSEGRGEKSKRIVPAMIGIAIIVNIVIWFVFKGTDLWVSLSYRIGKLVFNKEIMTGVSPLVSALGMGYYTLQVIGYILDCYWQTSKPQKNIFKLFLFVGFFPQLTTGPISRYNQLEGLFQKHTFSYLNVTHGAQRILWGFFKKLVIVDRVGVIVNGVWGGLATFSGPYIWFALLLFPIQMYADFSGCMDIVLGTAEVFGIILPENFKNPFFARTVQEFWQRWHITLGTWAKDYVLYPLLKSKLMIKFGKLSKKKLGKRFGKFLPTMVGMFCLWMAMGIWHGGFKYVIGVSLWYFFILMLGEFFAPLFQDINKFLGINEESFSWHLFQSIRTYLIYAIGAVFFRADGIGDAIVFIKKLIGTIKNPEMWVIFGGGIMDFGSSYTDINVIIYSILLLIIVAILREKHGFARIWMDKQILAFRWIVWIGLFFVVLILGQYGPGYKAAEFIYQGF